MRAAWILPAALLAVAGPAAAQSFAEVVQAAPQVQLGEVPPFAGVSTYGALSHKWTVLGFYVLWDRPAGAAARPRWGVRQAVGDIHGQSRVAWASSAACPALQARLQLLQALEGPKPQVPGLDDPQDVVVIADGVDYRLWSSSAWPGNGRMTLQSNTGTPLAKWTEDTLAALAPCWRAEPPASPKRG